MSYCTLHTTCKIEIQFFIYCLVVVLWLNFLTLLQEKRATSFEYGRYGNPTTVVLEEKIRLVF